MDRITISQADLQAALTEWELAHHRACATRTYEETQTLPVEQVAAESAAFLFGLLSKVPA